MNILVIGDAMLDVYMEGESTRLSPEAPVPVIENPKTTYALGGCLNVAANIKSLSGHAVSVASIRGVDEPGKRVERLAEGRGLVCLWQYNRNAITITKTRIISGGQQIARLDTELPPENYHLVDTDKLLLLEKQDIVVLSDYRKGALAPPTIQRIMERCVVLNIPVFVDTKNPYWPAFRGAFMITPNLKEAREATKNSDTLPQHLKELADASGIQNVLLKIGERGLVLLNNSTPRNGQHYPPTVKREVRNVTGAGDTVLAAMVVGHSRGWSLEKCCEFANYAAGIAVSHPGTYQVTANDAPAFGE